MKPERRRRRRTPNAPVPAPSTSATRGAIAAGGNVIDSIAIHAEHALPPEAYAPIPHDAPGSGVSNIPRSDLFVGREHELAALEAAFGKAGEVVVHAVHGLGGVGKSALAAHWAARRREPVRWWITADTPAGVDADLAALARALQPGVTQLPAESQTERAIRWLTDNHEWLLVLDNVENPSHIHPLVDRTPGGRVLITTRRATGWHHHARTIRLEVLEPIDATALFTRILTHHGPRGTHGTDALCEELGHLALAVEQAAAYCAETGTTPTAYLDMLARWPATMFAATAEGGDSTRTIARIWRVTLDRLAETPLAGEILRILAWYAPDHIPRDLLAPLAEPPELTTAIGRLVAHGMITDNHDGTLTIHRLVQSLARTQDPEDPHRRPEAIDRARDGATVLLALALPYDTKNPAHWPCYRALLPHVDTLTHHHSPDQDTAHTARILDRVAAYRLEQGATDSAIHTFRRAVTARQRALGDDHRYTLASRTNLADAYQAAANPGQAIPLYEHTLAAMERLQGNDHPDTMATRGNLADAYRAAGNPLSELIPLYERVLEDCERVLGNEDPQTLAARGNLAGAYQATGNPSRVIPLYESILEAYEWVLGNDHPSTLSARNNLANAYRAANDPRRAIPLLKRTVKDSGQLLGNDHPHTLIACNNLAHAYRNSGNLHRAIRLFERTLADHERALGNDHPNTMACRNDLAGAYREAGDPARAITLFEHALADRERVLGDHHHDTLAARNNLANAYREAHDPGRAIPLCERVLQDCERILGDDHPDTLTARNNLADSYQDANDPHHAIPLLERTLQGCERVLGNDHPLTLSSRNNLAYAYRTSGDLGRAIRLFERTLADRERVLGNDGPDTLMARNNLASTYAEAGDPGRAITLFERTLRDCERVLSPGHPTIALVRTNLERVRALPTG
ncbi:FxSxx-COOH system tetratricopeptide repeat protein [Embleya hyalina]|uniref:Tetratricopeptide repeat protein n=1 Tax=Embleya hyalina TaxID=516124 RepID=A0A401YGG9_9ACTN|nr:FxSxx-COOH system tetratricopeptide repeat protein [Embleya hyalina]GCD93660.1 tetratricopeptide repeat protein [Embleya hyalina]